MAFTWEQLVIEFGDALLDTLRLRVVQALALGWTEGGEAVALDLAFNLDNPKVQEALEELALMVRGISETTVEDIQRAVGKAADEGWSMARLAEEIGRMSEDIAPSRARTIAVTEMARAQSRGAMLAYEESGVVTGLTWLTTDPCPICAPNDGKVVPLGGAFPSGHQYPPSHPNCRCAIAAVV